MVAAPDTAIRTSYVGTTFRSRLEARWVVFFDAMGIAWTYQREGFALDGERMLPDFWLPVYGCFWDVPASQTIDEDRFGPWAVITSGPRYSTSDVSQRATRMGRPLPLNADTSTERNVGRVRPLGPSRSIVLRGCRARAPRGTGWRSSCRRGSRSRRRSSLP